MTLLITLVVILLLFGGWGYGPWNGGTVPGSTNGILGVLLAIIVIVVLFRLLHVAL